MKELGNKLKRLRTTNNMTQADLAKKTESDKIGYQRLRKCSSASLV